MSVTAIYPWQREIWNHLRAYIEQGRIPQALLLSGGPGLGKRHLADAYAAALLCAEPAVDGFACGHCPSCKLLEAGTHPDFLPVEPDEPGKVIGIDKIRQTIAKLALKPCFEAYRVAILQPADMMNTASANAFLKCLEEPTERTCFILITGQPAKLPATVRSRCQKIHCPPPAGAVAREWLAAQGVTGNAEVFLKLAQGAPLLAKAYAERQLDRCRTDYFQTWLLVGAGQANLPLLAEQWQKQEHVEFSVLLDWLIGWIRDIVKLALGVEGDGIDNPDLKKSLQALAERLELQRLFQYYDTVLRGKSLLATQVNKQLLAERLLIDWLQLNEH